MKTLSFDKKLSYGLLILAIALCVLYSTIGVDWENFDYALRRRLPNLSAMILTAFAISTATTLFQTLSGNHILTPSLFGLDALFGLVQTFLVAVLGAASFLVTNPLANFLLSLGVMGIFAFILLSQGFKRAGQDLVMTLMLGLVFGMFFRSATGFLQMIIDPNEFSIVQSRLSNSFNRVPLSLIGISTLLLLGILVYWQLKHRRLDLMALGRDNAVSLGLDYDLYSKKILLSVVLLTGVSTALTGPLSFLGLLIVNLARGILPYLNHQKQLVVGAALGIVVLVGGQLIVEHLLGFELPLSVVIDLLGGLYLLQILFKEAKR